MSGFQGLPRGAASAADVGGAVVVLERSADSTSLTGRGEAADDSRSGHGKRLRRAMEGALRDQRLSPGKASLAWSHPTVALDPEGGMAVVEDVTELTAGGRRSLTAQPTEPSASA